MILSPNCLFLLSIAAGTTVLAAKDGTTRPRGVGPEFTKFYKNPTTFTCISHPARQLPASAVNDDYCDCPDGSDEPGTSACAHVISRLTALTPADRPGYNSNKDKYGEVLDDQLKAALPGFYCKNKGHRPVYVPFQRVNDGVCDCCDGSDEWAGVGGVRCEDRCKEEGKEWRKGEEARQKGLSTALKRKKELMSEAGRKEKEIEERIGTLETEVKAEEVKVKGLEEGLAEVRREEEKRVRAAREREGGKLGQLVRVARGRVEELRNALVEVRRERDEKAERVKELEVILSKFKDERDPNSGDEGVKRALQSWEEYAARQSTEGEEVAARERDLDVISLEDSEHTGINWKQWEQEKPEGDLASKLVFGLLYNFLETRFQPIKELLEKSGILPPKLTDSVEETQAVTEARNALTAAQNSLEENQKNLREHRADLEKDYGPSSIFRPLKDKCISKDSGEYTYEHCFLDKTRQNSKKGGASVTMGRFERMGRVEVDEVDAGNNNEIVRVGRTTLEYSNGQVCWNGPPRSTRVVLECGEEDEIVRVMEDERCVYSMVARTPVVCEESASSTSSTSGSGPKPVEEGEESEKKDSPKDEL